MNPTPNDLVAVRQFLWDLVEARTPEEISMAHDDWLTVKRHIRATGNEAFDRVALVAEQVRPLLATRPYMATRSQRRKWRRDLEEAIEGIRNGAVDHLAANDEPIAWDEEEPGVHSAMGPGGTTGAVARATDTNAGATFVWVAADKDGKVVAEGKHPNHSQAKLHCAVAMRKAAKP